MAAGKPILATGLREDEMRTARTHTLLKEYGEVGQMFRKLTDIRFRLLSFIPLVSGASVALTVLRNEIANVGVPFFALFGLAITIGLIIYNARNDQLYNELVGRAGAIERSVGLHDGYFANRPQAWLEIRFPSSAIGMLRRGCKIDHGTALWLIYGTAIALWLSLLLAATFELARLVYIRSFPPLIVVSNPTAWVIVVAVALSIGATVKVGRQIKEQVKDRRRQLIVLAAMAYRTALSEVTAPPGSQRQSLRLIRLCIKLSGDPGKTRRRAFFYTHLDEQSLKHYWPPGPDKERAAHLVALLTDLPPRWIFECGEGKHITRKDLDQFVASGGLDVS
jgi:hypothetical protein